MTAWRASFLMLLTLWSAGCATTQRGEGQPFNRAAQSHIKTIGILTAAMESEVQVRVVNPAEENFPLLGPLIAEVAMAAKTDSFTDRLRAQKFSNRREIEAAAARALGAGGYKVVWVKAERSAGSFLRKYPEVPKVEALLDLYGTYGGYFATGSSTPYRPTYLVGVRLVDARSKKVLFTDTVIYNPIGDTGTAITIQADDRYAFDSYDDLVRAVPKAIEGLRAALTALGDRIGKLLT